MSKIELNADERSTLNVYILISAKYRKEEASGWEQLATELNEDGSLKYPNAPNNAHYFIDLEARLQAILKKFQR